MPSARCTGRRFPTAWQARPRARCRSSKTRSRSRKQGGRRNAWYRWWWTLGSANRSGCTLLAQIHLGKCPPHTMYTLWIPENWNRSRQSKPRIWKNHAQACGSRRGTACRTAGRPGSQNSLARPVGTATSQAAQSSPGDTPCNSPAAPAPPKAPPDHHPRTPPPAPGTDTPPGAGGTPAAPPTPTGPPHNTARGSWRYPPGRPRETPRTRRAHGTAWRRPRR
mmetsp:Transcript_41782/g.110118  ORF Transcript_41782/g.110118 Transcript_41782/m.110118 type:complete len:222 (+) Transcript_41782:999-1664(+)